MSNENGEGKEIINQYLKEDERIQNVTREYRKQQFEEIREECIGYKTKIKFIKPNCETNWIDIENHEFDQIKKILIGG